MKENTLVFVEENRKLRQWKLGHILLDSAKLLQANIKEDTILLIGNHKREHGKYYYSLRIT